MIVLRASLVVLLLTYELKAQHIFMDNSRRTVVVDSIEHHLRSLATAPPSFKRDTTIFFGLDKLIYHKAQFNASFELLADLKTMYADSMYRVAQRIRWPKGLAIARMRQLRAAIDQNTWLEILPDLVEATERLKKLELTREYGFGLVLIASGIAYKMKGSEEDLARGLEFCRLALRVGERTNDPELIHHANNYMGDFHVIRGRYREALAYYVKQIPMFEKNPRLSGLRNNLAYLGVCYLHLGNEALANHYFSRFFKICKPEQGNYATYLNNVVLEELAIYNLSKKQYRKALKYLLLTDKYINERGLWDREIHYERLSLVYSKLGMYKKAWEMRDKATLLNDSIKIGKVASKVVELERARKISEQQLQIQKIRNQALESDNKSQRITLILLSSVLVMSIGLLLLGWVYTRNARRKIDLELRLAETTALGTLQIISAQDREQERIARDLHDELGGTLAAIGARLYQLEDRGSLTETQKKIKDISVIIQGISDRLRQISHNLLPIGLGNLGLVNSVMELTLGSNEKQGIHFVCHSFGTERRLFPDRELALYRIISELLHNIRKHSMAKRATIQFLFHPDLLSISIEDDGNGFKKDEKGIAGIGQESIALRISFLQAQIQTESSDIGTLTILNVPYDDTDHTN